MIQITGEQIERVSLLLANIPSGTGLALSSIVKRASSTVRTQTTKQIGEVYAISPSNLRADTTIKTRFQKTENEMVGEISFSGFKIPLYRFNVSPKRPVQRAAVKASVLNSSPQTLFSHAFVAQMKSGHMGMFQRDSSSSLPITEFMGPSTAQMAANSVVREEVEKAAQETIDKRVEQEISRILNGYGGKL